MWSTTPIPLLPSTRLRRVADHGANDPEAAGEVGEAGDSEAEPVKSSPAQKAAIDGLGSSAEAWGRSGCAPLTKDNING